MTLRELKQLEASQNDGRGVRCVKTMIAYLELGQVEVAHRVFLTDRDKLRQYPELYIHLKEIFSRHGCKDPLSDSNWI